MEYVAYILEGNKGIKVGQTNNLNRRLKELKKNNVEVKAIIKTDSRTIAEIIEAVLRNYYINDMGGTRVGTDWIANVEYSISFMEDVRFKAISKMYDVKEVIIRL